MAKRYNLSNFEAPFKQFLLAENNNVNLNPITVKNYLSDLRHFLGWVNTQTELASISDFDPQASLEIMTSSLILNYQQYLYKGYIPVKTINRRLSTIRKFFSFCIGQGWIKHNPAKEVQNLKSFTTNDFELINQYYNHLVDQRENLLTIDQNIQNVNEFFKIINS